MGIVWNESHFNLKSWESQVIVQRKKNMLVKKLEPKFGYCCYFHKNICTNHRDIVMGSLSKKNCFYAFKWSCFCYFCSQSPADFCQHFNFPTLVRRTLTKVFSTKLQKLSDNIYSPTKLLSGIKVVSDVIHYNECIREKLCCLDNYYNKKIMFYAFSTSRVVMEYVSQVGRVSKGPFICSHGLQGGAGLFPSSNTCINWAEEQRSVSLLILEMYRVSKQVLDWFWAKKLNFENVSRLTLRWKSMMQLNHRSKNQILLSNLSILMKIRPRKGCVI